MIIDLPSISSQTKENEDPIVVLIEKEEDTVEVKEEFLPCATSITLAATSTTLSPNSNIQIASISPPIVDLRSGKLSSPVHLQSNAISSTNLFLTEPDSGAKQVPAAIGARQHHNSSSSTMSSGSSISSPISGGSSVASPTLIALPMDEKNKVESNILFGDKKTMEIVHPLIETAPKICAKPKSVNTSLAIGAKRKSSEVIHANGTKRKLVEVAPVKPKRKYVRKVKPGLASVPVSSPVIVTPITTIVTNSQWNGQARVDTHSQPKPTYQKNSTFPQQLPSPIVKQTFVNPTPISGNLHMINNTAQGLSFVLLNLQIFHF